MLENNSKIKVLLPLFLVLIIDTMGFGFIFPLLSPLFLDPQSNLVAANTSMALREFYFGISVCSFFVFMLIGSPFFGAMSDKLGRKKIMLLCLLGTVLAYAISYFGIVFHSLILFILGRCIAGLLAGSQAIAQAAIIDISSKEDKTTNLAMITLASSLGWCMGPLLGGIFSSSSIVTWFNYKTPFILAASLALFNSICLYLFFSETHKTELHALQPRKHVLNLLTKVFTKPALRAMTIIFILQQTAWSIYYEILSLDLVGKFHYSTLQIGLFNTYLGIAMSITMLLLIRLALRFASTQQITQFCLLTLGASILVNLLAPYELTYWLIILPLTISVGLAYTCILSLMSDCVSDNEQGWVMGIAEAAAAVSWSIGGFIVSGTGLLSHRSILIAAACISLIGFIFMLKKSIMLTKL